MSRINQTTLTALFDANAAALVLYARQWHGRDEAEDLVQDVFARLIDEDPAPVDARAWLFRCTRNAAISNVRARLRRRRREQERSGTWFDPGADALVDSAAVESAVAGLPPDVREVLVLRLWADLTLEQVASVTGRTVSSVFRRYRSGLDQVRRTLSDGNSPSDELEDSCAPTKKIRY